MAIIAPFSLLIAAIHTLNRLNGDSELIVLTASGATIWPAPARCCCWALPCSLGVSFVNHLAMPWSLRLLRQNIVQVRTDILTQVIQPGHFSSPEDDLTFHIRERTLNGESRASSCTTREQQRPVLPRRARHHREAARAPISS